MATQFSSTKKIFKFFFGPNIQENKMPIEFSSS
jgi:hypothetical protein